MRCGDFAFNGLHRLQFLKNRLTLGWDNHKTTRQLIYVLTPHTAPRSLWVHSVGNFQKLRSILHQGRWISSQRWNLATAAYIVLTSAASRAVILYPTYPYQAYGKGHIMTSRPAISAIVSCYLPCSFALWQVCDVCHTH